MTWSRPEFSVWVGELGFGSNFDQSVWHEFLYGLDLGVANLGQIDSDQVKFKSSQKHEPFLFKVNIFQKLKFESDWDQTAWLKIFRLGLG